MSKKKNQIKSLFFYTVNRLKASFCFVIYPPSSSEVASVDAIRVMRVLLEQVVDKILQIRYEVIDLEVHEPHGAQLRVCAVQNNE